MRLSVEPCMEKGKITGVTMEGIKTDLVGNVFDIQRYSIHDGPGIRTTVFLKGCPMRCKWCANPESWSAVPQLFFSRARCIKCGSCSLVDGITMGENGPVIEREKCRDMERAAMVCPAGALSIKGRGMTIEEVLFEIKKDIPFYKRSGGGVTVSGGEALLQAEFTVELLKACKEMGLHTVVETCGNVPWENMEAVIPYTDQFFYDVKIVDEELHKEYTGQSNAAILENLKKLAAAGVDICVRTPLIPGVNDKEEELLAIAHALKEFGIAKYELLAFHQYGKGKYESCGMKYELGHLEQMSEENKNKWNAYFEKCMNE